MMMKIEPIRGHRERVLYCKGSDSSYLEILQRVLEHQIMKGGHEI